MPVRFLSDAELAQLSGWPSEIAADDLITFFTLTDDDLGWLGSNYRYENRLGAAVQLCTLPWLGWIPDELTACPAAAVDRLADGLGIGGSERTELLSSYGGWEGRTRRDHRAQVLNRLGWRVSGTGDRKLLDEFLLARALEHDALGVLLQLACDWLRGERIVRPSVDTELGMTRLAWLRRGATAATPEVLKAELAKLEFLRGHGADRLDRLDLACLPAGRRRMLAETGRRSTNQALQRADVDRRHPILLATLAETYVEVLDELVQLLDQALADADSRARHELSQRVVDRARTEIERGRLLDEVLDGGGGGGI